MHDHDGGQYLTMQCPNCRMIVAVSVVMRKYACPHCRQVNTVRGGKYGAKPERNEAHK